MAAFAPQSAARGAAAGASPAKNACHGASGLRPARRPRGELRSAALRVTAAAEGCGVVRSGEPSSGRRWERLAGLRGRCDAVRCGAVRCCCPARLLGRADGRTALRALLSHRTPGVLTAELSAPARICCVTPSFPSGAREPRGQTAVRPALNASDALSCGWEAKVTFLVLFRKGNSGRDRRHPGTAGLRGAALVSGRGL